MKVYIWKLYIWIYLNIYISESLCCTPEVNTTLYSTVLQLKKNQAVNIFLFRLFSIIDYYKIFNIVLCTLQWVLLVFLYWLRQNCVWVFPVEVWSRNGLLQIQELWVKQTWVWHKLSWKRSQLTPPQSCQNLPKTGETDSWMAQTKLRMHQDPGERSSDPTRDWPRLACECPSLQQRCGSAVGCCRVGGLSVAEMHGTFEGGHHYLHYLHHSLAPGK